MGRSGLGSIHVQVPKPGCVASGSEPVARSRGGHCEVTRDWASIFVQAAPRLRWRVGGNPAIGPYVLVALLTFVCVLLRGAVEPGQEHRSSFIYYLPAVTAGAVLGGLKLSSFAVALGLVVSIALGGWAFLSEPANLFRALIFISLGVAGGVGIERFASGRLQIERALAEVKTREAHLRSIFAAAPQPMIVVDDKGQVRSLSATAEQLFGYPEGELVGRPAAVLMAEPEREEQRLRVGRYLATGEFRPAASPRTATGRRRDGSTFPMEVSIGEAVSAQARVFTFFVRDLTEQRTSEITLQTLQAELFRLSRVLSMGEMATAIAHELNQPLAAVTAFVGAAANLVESGGDKRPQVREALEAAAAQALRAGQIIQRLRSFVDNEETSRSVYSLRTVIEEAGALATLGLPASGLDLRCDFGAHPDDVEIDRVLVQQVLVNLIRNAVEAMEASSDRRLFIRTAHAGPMIEVSVRDLGPGVSPELAEQLFQPFTSTKVGGLGVGLSISRRIVEAHGGRVWLEPLAGPGCCFRFTLPKAKDPHAA